MVKKIENVDVYAPNGGKIYAQKDFVDASTGEQITATVIFMMMFQILLITRISK